MNITANEKEILRNLAQRVKEIAAMPQEETKRKAWIAHNRLENLYPLVCCVPEGAWLECIPNDSLKCSDPTARDFETRLRMIVYMHEKIRDDHPIDAVFNIGWGEISATESIKGLEYHEAVHSNSDLVLKREWYFVHPYLDWQVPRGVETVGYVPPMKTRLDPDNFVMPEFSMDHKTTDAQLELAEEAFGDILEVRRRGNKWFLSGGPGGAAGLRGLENLMMDMYDDPKWVHALIQFLCRAQNARLDFLEREGYITLNNGCEWIGTGGVGYSDELPAPDFNADKVRCQDVWGGIQIQDVTGISPDMFEEFFFPYIKPIMERYGLGNYGCCEPVHEWLPALMTVRHLRRISISPWADVRKCAEQMRGNYVFSYKPNPTVISTSHVDEAAISSGLEDAFRSTKEYGCPVHVLMKDLQTVQGKPERITRWVELARAAAEKVYG
ncbi:MAG: hypothetical protein JXN60_07360 [Lentisphaerae bacterium]|nr:hypothetical protein [Lentisphaerota bacterium]